MRERLAMWIAWHLPHEIVKWCFIRVTADVTTGPLSHRDMTDINPPEILKAWGDG